MISLGVDIGGTGCKCAAFSDSGEQLALCYEEYPIPAGTVNLPPDILTASVFQVIRNCAAALPDAEEVVAVTVSSFGESFVALNRDGTPLGDILMYFGNSESSAFQNLVMRVGQNRFMEICRILPDASYSLAKMLYTMETAPEPVWKFFFIAGYMCWKLSGMAATDVSLACRTLLYDVEKGGWSQELLEYSGIPENLLPSVVAPGTALGTILPEAAEELGLPRSTLVVLGTHDQIVNALGAGVQNPGDAADTSGTCECITPLFPAMPDGLDFPRNNFASVPYLQDRGFVTYAYNISAGSVVRWFRDALAGSLKPDLDADKPDASIYDILNRLAPSEPTGLMVLPFLQGMGGTPDVDPSATGLIAGLTTQTRLPDLYRAILEGITFEMRYNLEKLRESGITVRQILACGGGARSPVWRQIKADILGLPILPVETEETGALGSAILGFSAVTGEEPLTLARRFLRTGPVVLPIPAHQDVYNTRYGLYRTLRNFYREV